MSRAPIALLVGGVLLALIVLSGAVFIVPETRSAIVLRFGEPVGQYSTAGLKVKTPLIESVTFIDKRNRELDQPPIEIIASDQERLLVDAFARYRVIEPLTFYQALRTEENGEAQLQSLMNSIVRGVLSAVSVDDIVSNRRGDLMIRIGEMLDARARELGVQIVDVKIRRADLPPQNSAAVFQRMITERKQRAEQIRAEGREQAQRIEAQADREVIEIKARAEEEAQRIEGVGDAEKSAIYAAAYGRDREFFAFYRSLLAYKAALKEGETTILLSADNEFLRYFNSLRAKR